MLTLYTSTTTAVLFSLLFLFSSATATPPSSRRLLHQPFSPTSLNPSPSPLSSPLRNATAATTSSSTATTSFPFFPTFPTSSPPLTPPPPPPPPPSNLLPSFPANISSLALPSSSPSSSSHPVSPKLVILLIFLSFVAVSLLAALVILTRRKTHRKFQNAKLSDSASPPKIPRTPVTNSSSEFLYLGTLGRNSGEYDHHLTAMDGPSSSVPEVYIKLCGGSPELRPLPPLPKQSFHASFEHHFDEEEFFSPRGFHSTSHPEESENLELNSSENLEYESSGSSPSRDSDVSVEIIELAKRTGHFPTQRVKSVTPRPPAPPPPAPARGPPALVPPSVPVVFRKSGPVGERESIVRKEEMLGKTKLKGLYWDKVRASSDRVMVWDQLLPGSFQLNEEMIETLFKANGPNVGIKDGVRRSIIPVLNEETRVLDPKKSQNIAILLRALNVTEEEVCRALLEGNADSLGTELLESLLKMAPTIEEERKLKEYKDEPPLKLGPAEKFLKAVIEVPYAFKRVDAMLYIASFDSEVEYLKRSFETLEAACQELRNSRTFLKLLEAVLKTGNRMNVGTNRGDAQAIKLDTLLKLADIKGTDGKTTLLHFVVQEIIKAEGSRLSPNKKTNSIDDVELRKRGLEVVSSVVGELMNVKKAATMDKDILSSDVSKLVRGIVKVSAMNELMQKSKFSESMEGFLSKAEAEITRVQSSEIGAFSKVKELTEYFHGSSVKEEAHPLRIFLVVRDFLRVLDQVCKEVGKVNERTIMSNSSRQAVRQTFPPPFPELHGPTPEISLDDESITLD